MLGGSNWAQIVGMSSQLESNKGRPIVHLSEFERAKLQALLRGGVHPARQVRRAQILLRLDQDPCVTHVSQVVGADLKTVRLVRNRYLDGGLANALEEKPRPGAEPLLTPEQSQAIIAMVCSPVPAGRDHWSATLIVEETLKRGIVPRVGRETIRVLLKNHDLKPWREKNVVCAGADARVHRKNGGRSRSLQKAA